MNRERRKLIEMASALISKARNLVEEARDGEQEAWGNLPESIQDGERGEAMQTAIDALDEVASALEDSESNLSDARGG